MLCKYRGSGRWYNGGRNVNWLRVNLTISKKEHGHPRLRIRVERVVADCHPSSSLLEWSWWLSSHRASRFCFSRGRRLVCTAGQTDRRMLGTRAAIRNRLSFDISTFLHSIRRPGTCVELMEVPPNQDERASAARRTGSSGPTGMHKPQFACQNRLGSEMRGIRASLRSWLITRIVNECSGRWLASPGELRAQETLRDEIT